jgi:pantoate--beta-alanine ligase
MLIAKTNKELRKFLENREMNQKIGFVPTMGALHHGHLKLIEKSKKESLFTVVSIFVNPKQFNNKEDFNKYPITINEDIKLLKSIDCDLLYMPTYEEIYPSVLENIDIPLHDLDKVFEGEKRPGHFKGVAAVVHRLFSLVEPHKAFFGLKDFQQCLVIKNLRDQYFKNIKLKFCPTIREKSGLAMSSRNKRLSKEGLIIASNIYKAMKEVKSKYNHLDVNTALKEGLKILKNYPIEIDYFSVANKNTLKPNKQWMPVRNNVLLVAVIVEEVRLIDNIVI